MKIHKHINRNKDSPDFIDFPDQAPNGHSNKPTFSQIAQALPEIWPKKWTESSCCHGNVAKNYQPTNRNRDVLDYMGEPDQSSHCGLNKPTFS